MTFTIEQVIGIVGGAMVALVGFIFQGFNKRLENVEEKQSGLELHVAATYVQETGFKDALNPLFQKLNRMDIKIDDVIFKLAEKQDRPR